MKKFLRLDWDGIAGIVAAFTAFILHFFHVVEIDILLSVTVVLIALLFIRDMRQDHSLERIEESLKNSEVSLNAIKNCVQPTDVKLVGPGQLREVTKQFSLRAHGEMIWFHICPLMFRRQALFDALLKPAIDNPNVDSIQFIMDKRQRELWDNELAPKISACSQNVKVKEPYWTDIDDTVSVIASSMGKDEPHECLLSFWGEPFMANTVGNQVPRYIFHVLPNSELVGRLIELIRHHRVGG